MFYISKMYFSIFTVLLFVTVVLYVAVVVM
jgi:hypothetical protein